MRTTIDHNDLKKKKKALEEACLAANRDKALEEEIDQWQMFEDRLGEKTRPESSL